MGNRVAAEGHLGSATRTTQFGQEAVTEPTGAQPCASVTIPGPRGQSGPWAAVCQPWVWTRDGKEGAWRSEVRSREVVKVPMSVLQEPKAELPTWPSRAPTPRGPFYHPGHLPASWLGTPGPWKVSRPPPSALSATEPGLPALFSTQLQSSAQGLALRRLSADTSQPARGPSAWGASILDSPCLHHTTIHCET